MVGSWYNQLLIFCVDAQGNVTTNTLSLQNQSQFADTQVDTLIAAYQAASGCSVFCAQKQLTKMYAGTTTPGLYSTWADRAVFQVKAANNNTKVGLVGPLPGLFTSNTYTLNLSATQVVNFVNALKAIIGVGPTGSPILACTSGQRMQVNPFNVAP
jgi:hypothetical protein